MLGEGLGFVVSSEVLDPGTDVGLLWRNPVPAMGSFRTRHSAKPDSSAS